jgi:putative cardiolipin synthase
VLKALKRIAIFFLFVCATIFAIGRSSPLPSLAGRNPSAALLDTNDTRLGQSLAPLVAAHPGVSGIYPLLDSHDAFGARARLAQIAERTLDVQYYIWENDMTGLLLFQALREAADRGVRVRLLLDDNNTSGIDSILAALDAHPNIEVRLFNPFVIRRPRIGYITDFSRANRRMHNKSFTADNQATIIGGRNVGDAYFGATEGLLFVDLDVVAVGPVVTDVSRDFDRYWASESSYPVGRIVSPISREESERVATTLAQSMDDSAAVTYTNAIRDSPFFQAMVERRLPLEWAVTRMVSDDPAKGLGRAEPEKLFHFELRDAIGEPKNHFDLVAAYFVPTASGAVSFVSMAKQGVRIRVLTNSLEALDAPYVYAGYAKHRRALLEAGVALYEMKRLSPGTKEKEKPGSFRSSRSSLHAKTFAVDSARVFIGSFNFDPRSRNLNTELGFVIESPALAQNIESAFYDSIPANAYQVRLTPDGSLYWTERRDQELVRYDTEPGTTGWLRAFVWFLSLLPIDWLL